MTLTSFKNVTRQDKKPRKELVWNFKFLTEFHTHPQNKESMGHTHIMQGGGMAQYVCSQQLMAEKGWE